MFIPTYYHFNKCEHTIIKLLPQKALPGYKTVSDFSSSQVRTSNCRSTCTLCFKIISISLRLTSLLH